MMTIFLVNGSRFVTAVTVDSKIKNGLIGGENYKAPYVFESDGREYLLLVRLAMICAKKTFDMNDVRTHSQRIDMVYGSLFRLAPMNDELFLSNETAFPLAPIVDFSKDLLCVDWFPLSGVKCPVCLVARIDVPPLEAVEDAKTDAVDAEMTMSDLDARIGLFDFTQPSTDSAAEEYDGDDEEVKIDTTYNDMDTNRRYVFSPDNLFPLKSFVEHVSNKNVVDMPKWQVPNLKDMVIDSLC